MGFICSELHQIEQWYMRVRGRNMGMRGRGGGTSSRAVNPLEKEMQVDLGGGGNTDGFFEQNL
jgi:hypothetical protein